MKTNPLLAESALPCHFPPFDKIQDADFEPAFEQAMSAHLERIDAIARHPEPPTFENTVAAMERAGQRLEDVVSIFFNLAACHTNPALQAVERAVAPRLSQHTDAIYLNPALYARFQPLFAAADRLGLDAESRYLLERYEKDFRRAGARLAPADQEALRALNTELATLETAFTQALLQEKNALSIVVEDPAQLAGLPAAEIAAAEEGHPGRYVLPLLNTTTQPVLAALRDRALRERIMRTSLGRNAAGGDFDTRAMVLRIARARAERAALLGYASHAAYQLEDQTAGSVDTVNGLLADLAPRAAANARREAADLQAMIDQEGGGFQLAAWDWSFYSEKMRQARYAFDETRLRPYFELDRVLRDGVFHAASRFYGLSFQERHDLPTYHPDVRVFEVHDADGQPLALFLADLYARPSKRGGAWMNAYVSQSFLLGRRPVIGNHQNIPKPPPGEPTLLTLDEVRTMFHEFGHALHGIFSQVRYPRFSGTNVPRDFVELPSQINEMWMLWPEILRHYARHHETGEPIPDELVGKLLAADKFNQGYRTSEYLASSVLDQAWHQLSPGEVPADVAAYEAESLRRAGLDLPAVPPRYRSPYFSHSFSGSYSAGYYSYIWSEVLDAQGVEWIKAHGGLERGNGDHFRRTVLARGGSAEPLGMYHDFTGQKPGLGALLARRGLL